MSAQRSRMLLRKRALQATRLEAVHDRPKPNQDIESALM